MTPHIVALHDDVDHTHFWTQMETGTAGLPYIPDRRVEIDNEQKYIDRLCNYVLTEEEAEQLRNDPRVMEVVDPSNQEIAQYAVQKNVAYPRNTTVAGANANWALKRCTAPVNPYGTGSTDPGDGYPYTLDGTGVDIVIVDSGVEANHPEWQDARGNSRLQQVDWYAVSGVSGTQNANHYRDYNGHGTNVTSLAAGKTFGWAKNAKIYSLKLAGLEGTGDSGTGIPISDMWNILIGFHQNKTPDPRTGQRRPTICNHSWGYVDYFSSCTGGNYRGTPWTGSSVRTDLGMVWGSRFGIRYSSTDLSVEALLNAGIHVCIAAGNYYMKADVPGGVDYNNYWTGVSTFGGSGDHYYHQGGSPWSDNALIVGAVSTAVSDATHEYPASFSTKGPGVTVWAPGYYQLGACSTTEGLSLVGYPTASYFADGNYKQISVAGTSQASPNVCGVGALFLQVNPLMTPAQLRQMIINKSQPGMYSSGQTNTYTTSFDVQGGYDRYLYNPFNASQNSFLTGTGLVAVC
jgi:hypothetical protein